MKQLLLTLGGLWLGAVLIRGLYALVVPPFEAPDETSHYLYALHVARGWGLPPLVQRPGEPSVGWEAGQPPLTYLMVAPLVALAAPQTEEAWVPHPAGALAQPHSVGNKNVVAHIDGRYPTATHERALEAAFLWDASRPVDGDYRLFIEVWRDGEGLAARLETWPGSGAAPTRAWRPAMRFMDVYHIPLPATLLPGRYDVTIGFLDSAGARVQTQSGSGHVAIGSIQVLP